MLVCDFSLGMSFMRLLAMQLNDVDIDCLCKFVIEIDSFLGL